MTITLHTCVGIIVSRMFLIVSMVSCGEAVLLVSLLLDPGLGMLAWLTVGCWSDSLPNVIRAFSEILDMEIKRQTVVIFQQRCFNMLIEFQSCPMLSHWGPPVLSRTFFMIS